MSCHNSIIFKKLWMCITQCIRTIGKKIHKNKNSSKVEKEQSTKPTNEHIKLDDNSTKENINEVNSNTCQKHVETKIQEIQKLPKCTTINEENINNNIEENHEISIKPSSDEIDSNTDFDFEIINHEKD